MRWIPCFLFLAVASNSSFAAAEKSSRRSVSRDLTLRPSRQGLAQALKKKKAIPLSGHRTSLVSALTLRGGDASTSHFVRVLAQTVGVCVTLGSFTLKLPQIKRCVSSASVEGLSVLASYLELNVFLGAAIYHHLNRYPLSTWAENLALTAQQAAVIGLIWALREAPFSWAHRATFLAVEAAYVLGALSLPRRAWPLLLASNGLLNVCSNAAQISLNQRERSCGQVAPLTLALSVAGNLARVFTTLVFARGDVTLLGLFLLGAVLNVIRVVQFVVYANPHRSS